MEKGYTNSFEYGRRMAKILMVVTLITAAAALVLFRNNIELQNILTLVTLIAFCSVIYVMVRYCKCPHCGRHVVAGVLVVKVCPHCKRSFTTGKKIKK